MTEEWDRFEKDFTEESFPALNESKLTVSLAPTDGSGDVKFWAELGASIMLDKPILVLARNDSTVPPKLEKVADFVMWFNEGEMESLAERIEKWMDGFLSG